MTLALTVPDGLAVVANGLSVAKRRPRPGWTEHVWRDAVPSSTSLFGFAVGDFTRAARTISGVRFDYYGPELDAARRDELAAEESATRPRSPPASTFPSASLSRIRR